MKNIFVGNLSFTTTEADLQKLFEPFGTVASVVIMTRDKGKSRGFGFIDMPDPEQAAAAIAGLNGREFMGRPLDVNTIQPKLKKEPNAKKKWMNVIAKELPSEGERREPSPRRQDDRGARRKFEDRPSRYEGRNDRGAKFQGAREGGDRPYRKSDGSSKPWDKNKGSPNPHRKFEGKDDRGGRSYSRDERGSKFRETREGGSRPYRRADGPSKPWDKDKGASKPYRKFEGSSRSDNRGERPARPYSRDDRDSRGRSSREGADRPYRKPEGPSKPWEKSGPKPYKKFDRPGFESKQRGMSAREDRDQDRVREDEGETKPVRKEKFSSRPWLKMKSATKPGAKPSFKPGGFKSKTKRSE